MRILREDLEERPDAGRPQHVVVGGYGPIGRRVGEALQDAGIGFTVVELNPATVQQQSRLGQSVVFGDVANPDVLDSAGIDRADALVLTVPDDLAVQRACAGARRRAPHIFIAARGLTAIAGQAAGRTGADHVTVDELATAEAMAQAVMKHIGARLEQSDPAQIHGRCLDRRIFQLQRRSVPDP